jgi:hypothetical protein
MSAAANALKASISIGPIPAASCSAINSSKRSDFCASARVNKLDSFDLLPRVWYQTCGSHAAGLRVPLRGLTDLRS